MKQITFKKEAMEKMLVGFDKAANAVGGTLGPKGLNVFIDDQYTPKITNDGVTIAGNINLSDKLENAGAYIIKNCSSQTNDDVGDGTTTTSVLLHSIVHECLKRPENPMEIKESLKAAGDKILKILSKTSIKLNKEDIEKVAFISAENKEIAKLITEIINKLGEKAVINVEDSKTFATEYEISDGYEAKVGFMSPYFINDSKTGKSIHDDIPVLITEKRISNITDIAPLFDKLKEAGISKCAIVCDDIADDMLGVFVMSKLKKVFDGVVIRATGDVLKDIEGATGSTVISDRTGVNFKNIELKHLGRAKKLICDKNTSLFVGDGISAQLRASELDKQAEAESNIYLSKIIKGRADRLRGRIATLKIGAPTDFEREYLKLKAEDAVKAVQAALEEGIVEGGGMALWRIANELTPKTIGEEILKKSLKAPFKKIIENTGKEYDEIVKNMPEGKGYDAKGGGYENLIEYGIIDPTKVERCCLENAVSAASIFITTNCVIFDENEPIKN